MPRLEVQILYGLFFIYKIWTDNLQKVRGKSIFPRVVRIGGRTISGRGKHPLLRREWFKASDGLEV